MNAEFRDGEAPASVVVNSGNKATIRVLNVLSALAESPQHADIASLCSQLGMSRNMVYRALSTLAEHGYVMRDALSGKYDLGFGVLNLRGKVDPDPDVRSTCRPYLVELHEATGESAFLSIIAGYNRFNIDSVEARGVRVTHVLRGRPLPLHITITGRTLLASLSDAEIGHYICSVDFDEYPDAIASTPDKLQREIAAIRTAGFGFSRGETLAGLAQSNFVAFVVTDGIGRPHAAMTVGGPVERLTAERVEALLPMLNEIVAKANHALRHMPAPHAFWRET
jgi:DNA-binding IclR family transcriptional regulator